ncbi:MAG: hypothetical protein GXO64_04515 [Candidatus Micrarchaeota archaeon]|nr:hypothetical protein [Candidatus Micrarchaeota archaeon]
MIYDKNNSLFLATGLSLEKISEVLKSGNAEEKLGEFGEKYLKRYKTFKEYKELVSKGEVKDSLVPIIAALPCIGKTTVSREIATAFGTGNVMGGDSIRAAFRELISKKEHPEFFCSVYGAWQFVGDGTETEENIIEGFYKQSSIMNNLMQRIVADRGMRDGESMVIEYLHFLPTQYEKAVLEHPSVIPIVLRLDSKEEHERRVNMRDTSTHLKGNGKRLIPALEKYRMMQEVQCEDAKKAGVPVISTDNFEEALDKIFDIIYEHIERIIELKNTPHDNIEIIRKVMEERSLNPDK